MVATWLLAVGAFFIWLFGWAFGYAYGKSEGKLEALDEQYGLELESDDS